MSMSIGNTAGTELSSRELSRDLKNDEDALRRRARERRRRLSRLVRRALLGVGILAGLAGAFAALRPKPVPVDVAVITRGPLCEHVV